MANPLMPMGQGTNALGLFQNLQTRFPQIGQYLPAGMGGTGPGYISPMIQHALSQPFMPQMPQLGQIPQMNQAMPTMPAPAQWSSLGAHNLASRYTPEQLQMAQSYTRFGRPR